MKKIIALSMISFGLSFGLAQQTFEASKKSENQTTATSVKKQKQQTSDAAAVQKADWNKEKKAELKKNKNQKKADFRKGKKGQKGMSSKMNAEKRKEMTPEERMKLKEKMMKKANKNGRVDAQKQQEIRRKADSKRSGNTANTLTAE